RMDGRGRRNTEGRGRVEVGRDRGLRSGDFVEDSWRKVTHAMLVVDLVMKMRL
ncbi:hypothetical protein MKW92_044695, partial [Papaver armeniacum]